MRRVATKSAWLVVTTAVVASVASAVPARADQGDTAKGGCYLLTAEQLAATNGQNEGNFVGMAAMQHADGTPSSGTVTCWIDINGAEVRSSEMTFRNPPGFASKQVNFSAGPGDTVAVCEQVTFDDGSGWVGPDGSNPDCPAATGAAIPPQVVVDILTSADQTLVDPVGCPVLQRLAGDYGPLTIDPDGDVYIADPLGLGVNPIHDCPPFGPGDDFDAVVVDTYTSLPRLL